MRDRRSKSVIAGFLAKAIEVERPRKGDRCVWLCVAKSLLLRVRVTVVYTLRSMRA